MILDSIKSWKKCVDINGTIYDDVEQATKHALQSHESINSITLLVKRPSAIQSDFNSLKTITDYTKYKVVVRPYMTKPSMPGFDFMQKWNNDIPMPLVSMVGYKLEETQGMVKMQLWGDITSTTTTVCMRCGRAITNPVSQYFGMGPECGGHNYVHPFDTEEELYAAVEEYRKNVLSKITWTGWIIKSAILSCDVVD